MQAAAGPSWVEDLISTGGYPALAGIIAAENLVPPIPSEVVLPLAGFYVGQGTLSYIGAVIAATLGSVIGAVIIYAISRYGGRAVLERWGSKVGLTEQRLDKADDWFDRYGPFVVFFGRLIPGIRSLVSIPAGTSEMSVPLFLLLTTLGSLIWNAALIGAGWGLGSQWEQVADAIGPLSKYAIVGVLVAFAGLLAYWYVRRRRRTTGP
jgi:membrane protein DedA with SNARE-associated domain